MTVATFHVAGFVLVVLAGGLPGLAFGDLAVPASSVLAVSKAPSLNDTGATICYDPNVPWVPVQPIACPGTGQDGEFGRDVKHPDNADGVAGFSFIKVCNNGKDAGQVGCKRTAVQGSGPHDWGCTKDVVTGLTWELRTSDGSIRDASKFFSDFGIDDPSDTGGLVAAMNAQALCGATDWRLPSVTELFSLGNLSRSASISAWIPDLDTGYAVFWTSELHSGLPDIFAWAVDIGWSPDCCGPETVMQERDGRVEYTAARVVRGRGSLTHLVPLDDEVVDIANHLIWRRCVEGMRWQAPNCVGTPAVLFWSDALAYANAVAATTGVAWRLPNVKELQSLQVLSNEVTIDPHLFPQTPALRNWSSTCCGWKGIYSVDFVRGFATSESGINETNFAIRLVRDTN